MKKNRIESVLIYLIGFLVAYIGLFFRSMKINYGDFLYGVSELISPVFEYVLIFLGLAILIYQAIATNTIAKAFKETVRQVAFPTVASTVIIGFALLFVSVLLPAIWLYLLLILFVILLGMFNLVLRKDMLYISVVIFLFVQLMDDILLPNPGSATDIGLRIVTFIGLGINLLVVIDAIFKVIKSRNLNSNLIFVASNALIILYIYFVHEMFTFGSSTKFVENWFVWTLPALTIPPLLLFLNGKAEKIRLFH